MNQATKLQTVGEKVLEGKKAEWFRVYLSGMNSAPNILFATMNLTFRDQQHYTISKYHSHQNPLSFWQSLENIWRKQPQPTSRGKLPLLRSLKVGDNYCNDDGFCSLHSPYVDCA